MLVLMEMLQLLGVNMEFRVRIFHDYVIFAERFWDYPKISPYWPGEGFRSTIKHNQTKLIIVSSGNLASFRITDVVCGT